MADFTYDPTQDPARRGKASYAAGNNPGYPGQVAAYNAWLYTPMDRRPTPTPAAPVYSPDPNLSQYTAPGYHATDPASRAAIAQRYSPGGFAAPGVAGAVDNPLTGAAGASGPAGAMGAYSPQQSALDTAPRATYSGAPTPPQNAMQRWTSASQQLAQPKEGLKPLSDQRRYFWATGHVDARAPQADPSRNKGAIAPVTFNNSPSSWTAW